MFDKTSLPQSQTLRETQPPESDRNIITAAKGSSIDFVGQLFSTAVHAGLAVLLARLLGAEQLGLFALAATIAGVAISVSFLGLDGSISRYIPIALAQRDKPRIWGVIQIGTGVPVLLSLVLTFVLLVTAEPLTSQVYHKPAVAPVLRLMSLAIPLMVFAGCLSRIVEAFKRVQYTTISQSIVYTLLKIVLYAMLVIFGLGVMGVVAAELVAVAASTALLVYFVHRLFPLNRSVHAARRNIGEMFRFSLPLYMSRLLNQFGGRLETLVLGLFGVVADVGIYSTVLRVSSLGNMFFDSMRKISTPVISELYSQGKYAELERFYQTTTKWAIMFNLPIFGTFLLFADSLLYIFGKEFTAGAAGLIVLAGAALFNASTGTCGTVINMTGHSRLSLVNSIIYLGSSIIIDFLLIPRWQLVGAAWAGGLTIVINNTLRMIEVYFLVHGLLPFNRELLKPLSASLLAIGLTYLLTRLFPIELPLLRLILMAPIMWAVYVVAILMLRLSDEDYMVLDMARRRFLGDRFQRRKA
jgi:O-antigen/teichoic acid export membrane protein